MATLPVSYTTVSLVMETLPDLGSASNVNSAVIFAHAGRVQAVINAKLAGRYTLPFALTPPLLESIATDLTIYSALVKTSIIANTIEGSPWPDAYKASMDLLQQIADGAVPLVDSAGALIAQTNADAPCRSSSQDYVPTFSELPPSAAKIDRDKIDDLLSEREG